MGFESSEWFTVMLLDVFNTSASLGNIVRSVSLEAKRIGLVFYVFLITMVIWGSFGVIRYASSMNTLLRDG